MRKRIRNTIFIFLWLVWGSFWAPEILYSQEARGTITGKIYDPGKAIIPGATVKITHLAMGISRAVQTNDSGVYAVPYLIPGIYQMEVEMAGFKKKIHEGIELHVSDLLQVDITLEMGVLTETVTVTGETPQLEAASASMGSVIDSRRVAELPIVHGNPYGLIGLAGGVAFTGSTRLDRPFEPTQIVGYSIDGTRRNRSDITLDGAPSTATANPGEVTASYVPPSDIVAEFKVQTAVFDAAFGQTEGGVTNINIKSGTNDFHGTAYYSMMAPGLSAADFFANKDITIAQEDKRGPFNYKRYGGSAGGPLILPKLYNGRDKTFFLFGYEGIKEARPRNDGSPTIPTAAMKKGDFSQLLALGSAYQIYNPFTRRKEGLRFRADPFPGNMVPSSLMNPVLLS